MSATGRPTVEFFYCCSCPWTYLALGRLHEAAIRTGARIEYRPILSAWIDDSAGPLSARSLASPDPAVAASCGPGASQDLSDAMHAAWVRFITTHTAPWAPWHLQSPRTMVFDAQPAERDGYVFETRAAHFTSGSRAVGA